MCLIHAPEACTEEELRETWEREKDSLIREWVRERPGTRPWAFWEWDDNGKPRRLEVKDGVHPFDNKERTLWIANSDTEYLWKVGYELHWGRPRCITKFDHGIKYEDEWEYLVRYNLLLPEDSP
jgi:hypothetical protein